MTVNQAPERSGAFLRDGLVCWSVVLLLDGVTVSERDDLHFSWGSGFSIDIRIQDRSWCAWRGVIRATACGVVVEPSVDLMQPPKLVLVAPPLTCLGCLDAMGLYPFPDFAAWNATASHRLALGLCL